MPPGKGRKRDAAQSAQVDALMQAAEVRSPPELDCALMTSPDVSELPSSEGRLAGYCRAAERT